MNVAPFCMWLLCLTTVELIRIEQNHEIEELEVPIGGTATLHCKVILEQNDRIYSLKWFKRINGIFVEFYSYIADSAIHHRPLPGVEADGGGQLTQIVNVNLDSEGLFRCEVISDEVFQLDRKEFNLTVLVPPLEAPIIKGARLSYGLGERVQLRCLTDGSRPWAPTVHWLVSGHTVPESYLTTTHRTINHHHLTTGTNTSQQAHTSITQTISDIDFILTRNHLIDGKHFIIRCVATFAAELYPDVHHQEMRINVWHPSSPVIVGLQPLYSIGDLIDLNCTIPAFELTAMASNSRFHYNQNVQLEWYINEQQASSDYVVDRFEFGQSGLRFTLESCHLADGLSIKCKSIQSWPRFQFPVELLRKSFKSNESISSRTKVNLWNETNVPVWNATTIMAVDESEVMHNGTEMDSLSIQAEWRRLATVTVIPVTVAATIVGLVLLV